MPSRWQRWLHARARFPSRWHIDADLKDVDSVILGQVAYSIPELRAKVDEFLAAQDKLRLAENLYQAALAAHRTSRAAAETFRGQLQAYVAGRHGKSHAMLTRKERGTVSKQQRARMPRGKVDEVVVAKLLGQGGAKKTAEPGKGRSKKT